MCHLSGPELFASDYRSLGVRGRVAVPIARRISDGQLQRGSSALLPHRTPHLVIWNQIVVFPLAVTWLVIKRIKDFLRSSSLDTCSALPLVLRKRQKRMFSRNQGYCAGNIDTQLSVCLFYIFGKPLKITPLVIVARLNTQGQCEISNDSSFWQFSRTCV